MSKLIMTKGLPAAGKTTWAWEYLSEAERTMSGKVYIVTKDDLRAANPGLHEDRIIEIRDAIIRDALSAGRTVISADTNFNPIHEKRLRELAKEYNADFEIKDFTNVPLDECIKRDLKRDRSVGEKVIRQMHNQYIRPTLRVQQNQNLPEAYIFDIDGTLANLNGRNPYDATDCEYDILNDEVAAILYSKQNQGYKIIITSGRSDKYLAQTDRWLTKHGIEPDLFLMRKEGDTRKDYEVKKEMFMKHILPYYYVCAAFDDRNRIVDLWRDLGIFCFQVGDGWF